MELGSFVDRTCSPCYSVKDGKWVAFGPKKTEGAVIDLSKDGLGRDHPG